MSADFTMDAEFDSKAPYRCACCEYRQKLRATVGKKAFNVDGNPIDYRVVDPNDTTKRISINDQPQDFVEDFANYGAGNIRYGHRGEAKSADEDYTNGGSGPTAGDVNRATGCHYHGHDRPGISSLRSGHSYEVNLVFRVEIVCAETGCGGGGPPHRQKDFNVALQKTQP